MAGSDRQEQTKYLVFLEDIVSSNRLVKWLKGSKYKVIDETENLYYLEAQNKIELAIEKNLTDIKYEVRTK